jgi:hypothetical protein
VVAIDAFGAEQEPQRELRRMAAAMRDDGGDGEVSAANAEAARRVTSGAA